MSAPAVLAGHGQLPCLEAHPNRRSLWCARPAVLVGGHLAIDGTYWPAADATWSPAAPDVWSAA